MVRNVIFDWSGTLVDDLGAVWDASNHVFRQAGAPEMTLEEFRREFRLPFESFYNERLVGLPIKTAETWFHERFVQIRDQVEALPHARSFLEFSRDRGWRLFLLSAVHPGHFPAQTRDNGFDAFFERTYLGVADKRTVIRELMSRHALEPDATLFVGDMEHDMDAARAAGVAGVAVLTGYSHLTQLRSARPALIVEHLGELRSILERHDGRLPDASPDARGSEVGRRPVATVGALVFDGAGKVLLVQTNKWSSLWGIPGGKIEYGETSEAALRRELLEETGLIVTDIRFAMVQDAVEPPEFYKSAHFILLNYTCRAEPGPVRLNHEAQEYGWFEFDDAWQLPLNAPTRRLLEEVRRILAPGSNGGRLDR